MISIRRTALLITAAFCIASCAPAARTKNAARTPSLIPEPALVEPKPGTFELRQGAALIVDSNNAEAAGIARRFAKLLAETRGLHLDVRPFGNGDAHDAIVFSLDARTPNVPSGEGYDLAVDAHRIVVAAREPRGLFYGSVTLWQLLTEDTAPASRIEVAQLHIEDRPRFAWRGAMLDSARHFQSPDFVKRFIDEIARLKLNTFHWHLTDDQGWRIEIKRYPRLTDVGAWRRPAGAAGTDANGQPVRYGGFYTQDEIRDIVRYAAERYVTIVPEIDLPGHMQAAIAAYPDLGSRGDTPPVSAKWGVHPYLVNVDESTIEFFGQVFDEVADLFPSPIIHIGGDEALKDQWKTSPRVQVRMHALGIADENALQGWLIDRIAQHLAARGKRIVGWDEILEGGVPSNAIVMSWRGAQGGIDAAQAGHDVVMSPSPDLYLDHLQGDADDAPPGRPDLRTLADVYAFQPIPPAMSAETARHVLGAQANLWTEHMRSGERVEEAAFPRLDALADVLWSPPSTHEWRGFTARVAVEMQRHRALGVRASASAFEIRAKTTYDPAMRRVGVELFDQVGFPIRYTIDGRVPDASSPLYATPLDLPVPSTLRAVAFHDERAAGPVLARDLSREALLTRSSAELKPCAGNLTLRLEDDAPADAPRAIFNVDLFDPCWIWPNAPLDAARAIAVTVGQIPYNFELAHDAAHIVPRPAPTTRDGELRITLDRCDGPPLATLPLDAAIADPATTTLTAERPAAANGTHDLCFRFATRGLDPLWTIDRVRLVPASR